MNVRVVLSSLVFPVLGALLAAAPASNPTSAPELVPDLTPRQQNLLMQLSDAEANIQAINKALLHLGYKVGVAYDRIDSGQKGNEFMDRKGGGPVRWDEFYGRTARDFYAPESLGTAHRAGGGKTIDLKVADNYKQLKRPSQFDFIYRANNEQVTRAKEQVASLAQDQATLLSRRQKHEADQCRLWATLSWEQVKDREISLHPLCRFALKPSGPDASVLRPLILFLRTADRTAVEGLDSIEADPEETFQSGSKRMEAALTALEQSLADALDDSHLAPQHKQQGQTMKTVCKDLAEECRVITDDYNNALDRDKANQDTSKLEFRGQLQFSLARFAAKLGTLDNDVQKTAGAWGISADKSTLTPDVVPAAKLIAAAPATSPTVSTTAADTVPEGAAIILTAAADTTEVGTLDESARIFSNRAYKLSGLPDNLKGLQFTRRPGGAPVDVQLKVPGGNTVYLMIDSDHGPNAKNPALPDVYRLLLSQGWERKDYTIHSSAHGGTSPVTVFAKRFAAPAVEKIHSGGFMGVIVVAKQISIKPEK